MPPSNTNNSRVPSRPMYPSAGAILVDFLWNDLVMKCLVGAMLMHLAWPVYVWTRECAQKHDMSDAAYFAAMITVLHSTTYVVVNLPHFVCDTLQILQNCKLYRKSYMTPSRDLLVRLGVEQFVGQLIVGPMVMYAAYPIIQLYLQDLDTPKPTTLESFTSILIFLMSSEFYFYWGHRLLHDNKWLYKTIHKKHHEFSGSVGYAAEHCHPLEGILVNQLSAVAGMLLIKVHVINFMLWIFLRLEGTYTTHSGYCFLQGTPLEVFTQLSRTAFHDFHHTHNQGNYGAVVFDWLFGTMDHWQAIGGLEGYLQLKEKETVKDNANKKTEND